MIELLAPCGGMEQLKVAIKYGADAVYMGTKQFSLRAHADHPDDLGEAVGYAHARGKRIYITMNAVVFPSELEQAKQTVERIAQAGADGIILSDPGLISLAQELGPKLEIHLSTQTSTCNQSAAAFWHQNGVRRIVLGRECTLADIKAIRENTQKELELEAFCHGAMCIAYSGRCLLSAYFNGRSANCGDCTQPCRWEYHLTEVKRPQDALTLEQDQEGSYVLSSRDLCMIEHLPDMIDAGITSLKIEGRMKTAFYVGTVVRAYRRALDAALAGEPVPQEAVEETHQASHRRFTTGFYYGDPLESGQHYSSNAYLRESEFSGIVLAYDPTNHRLLMEQRSRFFAGDELEVLGEEGEIIPITADPILDEQGNRLNSAPHPKQRVWLPCPREVSPDDLIRKRLP